MTNLDEMIDKAKHAYKNSYSPYSNFPVGACIRTDDDRLFVGTNVENAAYGSSLCAEMSAISAMITSGGRKIKEVVIVVPDEKIAAPCGNCRQRIYEFASSDTLIHLYNAAGEHETLTLNELLPFAFGPDNLE